MSLTAKRVGKVNGRKPKSNFEQSRICETDGCLTILSIYNLKKNCFNHRPKVYPRVRGHIKKGEY